MKTILYGRLKQGLHGSSSSFAVLVVSSTRLVFIVGFLFKSRYEFTPEDVRRFHRSDAGLRIYHNRSDCASPVVFKVSLFKSQNLTLRTIKRCGFIASGARFSPKVEKLQAV
jgi:hypothetical protein